MIIIIIIHSNSHSISWWRRRRVPSRTWRRRGPSRVRRRRTTFFWLPLPPPCSPSPFAFLFLPSLPALSPSSSSSSLSPSSSSLSPSSSYTSLASPSPPPPLFSSSPLFSFSLLPREEKKKEERNFMTLIFNRIAAVMNYRIDDTWIETTNMNNRIDEMCIEQQIWIESPRLMVQKNSSIILTEVVDSSAGQGLWLKLMSKKNNKNISCIWFFVSMSRVKLARLTQTLPDCFVWCVNITAFIIINF